MNPPLYNVGDKASNFINIQYVMGVSSLMWSEIHFKVTC